MAAVSVWCVVTLIICSTSAREPTPPSNTVQKSPNGHGVLKPLENAHLLQISGNPFERGYAHGFLLATQIIDWSVFYQFQTNMKSNATFYELFANWLMENQFVEKDFDDEVSGVLAGMKDSGVSLSFDGLGRNFQKKDIYVINAYLEGTPGTGAMDPGPIVDRVTMSCTQFVAWGRTTVDGHTIAGRNMDGETDPYFVTATHLIVFAVEPYYSNELRFVSIMWPGHIGSLSAMNEKGLSAMLNCGSVSPSDVPTNITLVEYSIRKAISTLTVGSPQEALGVFDQYKCSTGGATAAGSVIVFSAPVNTSDAANVPGFVFESDRVSGRMRYDTTLPYIYQSNHFLSYGVDKATESDPGNPSTNFGALVSFDSRWRLQVVRSTLDAINRTVSSMLPTSLNGFGLDGSARILQAAAHGYTEHSVAFEPKGSGSAGTGRPRFALANSDPRHDQERWDAPYHPYVVYEFDEMFG